MFRLSRGVVSVVVWTRISVLEAQVDPGIQGLFLSQRIADAGCLQFPAFASLG